MSPNANAFFTPKILQGSRKAIFSELRMSEVTLLALRSEVVGL